MTRRTAIRATLPAACAAALLLASVPAGAQQVLVPAQPGRAAQVARPAAPDWFESNRVLDVVRAQELPQPASRSPSGLGGAEAAKVYQNHLLGIGQPPLGSSEQSGFGSPGGFGGSKGSGYGGAQ